MALIFAMQAYQRPPFLVLDEVDAYLDANNVHALAKYVEQSDCQTIVISLKDKLFSRSEGLVGVTMNKIREASVILTVDLARFRRAHSQVPASAGPVPLPSSSAGEPPDEEGDTRMEL